MLSPARRRVAALWACALLGCLPTARAFSPILALRAVAFLGCLYRAYATPGVAKEIVDSALVFDNGEVASGLKNNDDAVQCLRAAIAEVLTISMSGIDAQTVLDDLTKAAVDTTSMMAQLNLCGWPFDAIDKKNTDHVLQTETFQRAAEASVGAVVSSVLVFDNFGARTFNDDSVAVLRFKDIVASILTASTLQIDNVLADDPYR